MAEIEQRGDRLVIVPQTEPERQLIAHGVDSGGSLILDEAFYGVTSSVIILPDSSTIAGAGRLRESFERAAEAHARAVSRRRKYRLVKP